MADKFARIYPIFGTVPNLRYSKIDKDRHGTLFGMMHTKHTRKVDIDPRKDHNSTYRENDPGILMGWLPY
jgi:hypothetical protein